MPLRNSTDPNWTGEQIQATLTGEIHPFALEGIRSFNRGEYFEAHEELEIAWRDEPGAVRDVYRGILQVGLGYYHIQRGNYRGAVKMFQRCRQWLDPFPDACRGIDLAQLRVDFLRAEAELMRLGPEQLSHFNPLWMRPICFVEEETKP